MLANSALCPSETTFVDESHIYAVRGMSLLRRTAFVHLKILFPLWTFAIQLKEDVNEKPVRQSILENFVHHIRCNGSDPVSVEVYVVGGE